MEKNRSDTTDEIPVVRTNNLPGVRSIFSLTRITNPATEPAASQISDLKGNNPSDGPANSLR
jgi:hypothetical protein